MAAPPATANASAAVIASLRMGNLLRFVSARFRFYRALRQRFRLLHLAQAVTVH